MANFGVRERFAMTQRQFDTCYQAAPPPERNICSNIANQCSSKKLVKAAKSRLPVLDWLVHYKKEDLIPDIIAGLTVTIFQVPQGMAYSLLAGVSAKYGLYTSLFPVVMYFLFGTSKQASVGSFAVTSLMAAAVVNSFEYESSLEKEGMNFTMPLNVSHDALTPIKVASTLAFLVGLLQIIFGLLHFGFVSTYMSEILVSGFTTGSALQVFSSQLKDFLGINIKSENGLLAVVYTFINVFENIKKANLVTFGIAACSVLLLLFTKEFIDPRTKKYIKMPIPTELLVVIIGTVLSSSLDLHSSQNVAVVGDIPSGIPAPSLPVFSLFPRMIGSAIALSIVSFTSTLSLGQIFAQKYNYEIDANQELLALGSSNIFGSFFSCIPVSGSLSRSSVQDGAGGRTQLVSLINCCGMVIMLLFLSRLLETLPRCILAAIIMVALKNLLLQIRDLKRFWKVSKFDALVWIVTFLSVALLDVDIGLGIGVGVSLLSIIFRMQRPDAFLLGPVDNTGIFVPISRYYMAKNPQYYKVFKFCSSLHYANVDYFKNKLIRLTGIDPVAIKANIEKLERKKLLNSNLKGQTNFALEEDGHSMYFGDESTEISYIPTPMAKFIILDFSVVPFVDYAGISCLKQIITEYNSVDISVIFSNVSSEILNVFKASDLLTIVSENFIFPSNEDAALFVETIHAEERM